MTTPIVHRLREENPRDIIHVQTFHGYVYKDNPDVTSAWTVRNRQYYDREINLDLAYEKDMSLHQVDAYMRTAFSDEDGDKSIRLAKVPLPFWPDWSRTIVLHPAVSWPNRTLSQDWWQELGQRLHEMGYSVFSTGTMQDHKLRRPITNLQGRLNLNQQAELIDKALCFVASDSGPIQIVGATDTPLVGLFTITSGKRSVPYRHGELGWNATIMDTTIPCGACREALDEPVTYLECKYGHNDCVRSFDIDQVVVAITASIICDKRK